MDKVDMVGRLEWDNDEFNKAAWGKGEWLDEPDKVQCIKEGYHCLILRAHHGAFCGYIGVHKGHPCYGLTGDGISALVTDIIQADFKDRLETWGRKGMPLTESRLPDMQESDIEWPEPETETGKAMLNIQVHGGLTYAGANKGPTEARWQELKKSFPLAREAVTRYPIGDAARWLHKWNKAENSYAEFKRIVEQTCICLVGLPSDVASDTELWWLGFDCAYEFDLCPQIKSTLQYIGHIHPEYSQEEEFKDVYRNLAYVENECLQLAIQLRAIEEHAQTQALKEQPNAKNPSPDSKEPDSKEPDSKEPDSKEPDSKEPDKE